jgi:hypothetical protein
LPTAKRLDLTPLKGDEMAFIQKVLNFEPHPSQIEFLQGLARQLAGKETVQIVSLLAGRQWGKSTILGADGAYYGATHANRQVYCVAPTLDQARIIFNEIAGHFRRPPLSYLVDGKIVDYPFPHFKLLNGTEFHGRGANAPQYIRGKRAHRVYADEASFIKDKTLTDVIEPMFTVTGKEADSAFIPTSTPFGQGTFYEWYELGRQSAEDYLSFRFTSEDNPFADRKLLARVKERYGEDSLVWRTEYLALFPDSDMAVFPWRDIAWAYEHWPYLDKENGQHLFPIRSARGHRYVQGVDLANRRDYFVSTILDVTDPLAVPLVHYDRMQGKDYPTYKSIVRDNYSAYNTCDTLVDATSLGESVAQDLADIGAEGYKFGSAQQKAEVVYELKRMLSEHRLLIPYDRDIIDELRYFEYDITPNKVIRMEASKGHDDIVMSLALAAHLAVMPFELGLFQGVDLRPSQGVPVTPPPTSGRPYYDPFAELFME